MWQAELASVGDRHHALSSDSLLPAASPAAIPLLANANFDKALAAWRGSSAGKMLGVTSMRTQVWSPKLSCQKPDVGWAWWCTPVMPTLRGQSRRISMSLRPAWSPQ